jgi:hypothetical protein
MTSASSLAFPGSRTLAGWWRQLSPHQPAAIAFGHLFYHRVEAAVTVERVQSIDRLGRLVLEALELETTSAAGNEQILERLQNRSHLEPSFLHQMLRHLQASGLVDAVPRWVPSTLGRHALRQGHYTSPGIERRLFHFVEGCNPLGQRTRAPLYVPLRGTHGSAWQPNDTHAFEPVWLRRCLQQQDDWKEAHGFPADVVGLPETPPGHDVSWRQVLVDYPEQMPAVLILVGGQRLLGFAVRQEGWQLQATEPILMLNRGWEELFPELIAPPQEALAAAWSTWAQAHGLGATEAAGCTLTLAKQRLRVQMPPAILQRLQNVRGENWLLLGDAYVRAALQLELA